MMHFSELTQNYRDAFEPDGNCLSDLIEFLNKKYKGFKKELMDPASDRRTKSI
jgi:hypothetical protein